jgi:hypothetical protein
MNDTRFQLLGEVRYAERLAARTARLYRRVQTLSTFMAIVGGSAALASLVKDLPIALPLTGAAMLSIFGALSISIRPADKAAQNETDARRYSALMTKANDLDDAALRKALDETHQAVSTPEVEPLRVVVYNDVVREVGQPSYAHPLNWQQRMVAMLA